MCDFPLPLHVRICEHDNVQTCGRIVDFNRSGLIVGARDRPAVSEGPRASLPGVSCAVRAALHEPIRRAVALARRDGLSCGLMYSGLNGLWLTWNLHGG